MESRQEVTLEMRRLFNLIRRLAEGNLRNEARITPMQSRVIGFIHHHLGEDVYQRDLERTFEIRRSTASTILQTMEKNGLLRREAVAHDARLKRLVLTEHSMAHSQRFQQEMARVEANIVKGVTPEEMAAFFSAMSKFQQNLNEYLAQQGSESQRSNCGEANE